MIQKYLSLVKFSHTIFALPFAMVGSFLAFKEVQHFDVYKLIYIIICMVTARSAAMAFNRLVDRDFDKLNNRTAIREIPAGVISAKSATFFVFLNCLIFTITTYFINELCFYLSPVALFVVLFYSYTKRFTFLCHVVLGVGLGLAPVGAFAAIANHFSLPIVILGFSVMFWVAGFDIIYSLQDEEFDKSLGLNSIPTFFGKKNALIISKIFHAICLTCIFTFGYLIAPSFIFWIAFGLFFMLIIYQHSLVSPTDLSKINLAFFTTNGIGSLVFGTLVVLDFFINK